METLLAPAAASLIAAGVAPPLASVVCFTLAVIAFVTAAFLLYANTEH